MGRRPPEAAPKLVHLGDPGLVPSPLHLDQVLVVIPEEQVCIARTTCPGRHLGAEAGPLEGRSKQARKLSGALRRLH